jgi:hypothetical protein
MQWSDCHIVFFYDNYPKILLTRLALFVLPCSPIKDFKVAWIPQATDRAIVKDHPQVLSVLK